MKLHVLIVVILLVLLIRSKPVLAYVKGKVTDIAFGSIGGQFVLRKDAAESFNDMKQAAHADGVLLVVNSAFRTMEEQEKLRIEKPGLAAKPGYSPHQAGIAVDLDVDGGTNAAYRWLRMHAEFFGWYQPLAKEPWHWEYSAA